MASADLSFTKDGLIYRPQHQEDEEEEDFLTERQQKDGGAPEKIMQQLPTFFKLLIPIVVLCLWGIWEGLLDFHRRCVLVSL